MIVYRDIVKLLDSDGVVIKNHFFNDYKNKAFTISKKQLNNAIQTFKSNVITDRFDLTGVDLITEGHTTNGAKIFNSKMSIETLRSSIRSDIFFAGIVPIFDCNIQFSTSIDSVMRSYYGEGIEAVFKLFGFTADKYAEINQIINDSINIHIDHNYYEKVNKLKEDESVTVGYVENVPGTTYTEIIVTKGSDYVNFKTIDSSVIANPNRNIEKNFGDDIEFLLKLISDELINPFTYGNHSTLIEKMVESELKNINLDIDSIVYTDFTRSVYYSIWYSLMVMILNPIVKTVYVPRTVEKPKSDTKVKNEDSDTYRSNKNKKLQTVTVRYHTLKGLSNTIKSIKGKVRHCMLWPVHGHFRHYKKSGKTIFIQPYWKGELRDTKKKEVEPNKYKI